MAKNHLKLGDAPFLHVFLMCASIIFCWVAAQGPKGSFFKSKLGARLKNMGLRCPRCSHKKFIGTHLEEGGQVYRHPRFLVQASSEV